MRLCGYCSNFLSSSAASPDSDVHSVGVRSQATTAMAESRLCAVSTVSAGSLNWSTGDPLTNCQETGRRKPTLLSVTDLTGDSSSTPGYADVDQNSAVVDEQEEPEWVRSIEIQRKDDSFVSSRTHARIITQTSAYRSRWILK